MLQNLALIFPSVPVWVKVLVLLLPMLPNFWCILQSATKNFKYPTEKFAWLAVGVFLPVLGGVFFLVWGRNRIVRPTPACPA